MKYWNKKRIIFSSIFAPLILAIVVGLIIGQVLLYSSEATITSTLSPNLVFSKASTEKGESAEAEVIDVVQEKINSSGLQLSKKIIEEGSVLVRNENNLLPLNKETDGKVNLFGRGSVDWITGGSSSGQVISEPNTANIALIQALQRYGISNNINLERAYTDYINNDGSKTNEFYSLSGSTKNFYRLYEPSLSSSKYFSSSILESAKNYSQTAFVVLNRRGGESKDPTRVQYKGNDAVVDKSRHYLEITTEEEEMLTYVGANFERVVVLINSTNTMELGFLETIPGLDACLIVGATGTRGADAIPSILYGDVNPSGRTVDTYPYKFSSNINFNFSAGGTIDDGGVIRRYSDAPSGINASAYLDYVEGVYLGYRWYETADKEGYWDNSTYNGYDNVVQYPFGYGLSYTTFDWEILKNEPETGSSFKNNEIISIYVKVTNTGKVAGKDVIEVYLTPPYTKGGIEKSHVALVQIAKTPLIEPGKNITLKIKVNTRDFENYDCYDKNKNGFKGYELEAGEYQLKLMENSHIIKKVTLNGEKEKEAILTYKVDETITVENDELTGNKVENRFTGEDSDYGISIDGSTTNENINFISRESFPDLATFKQNNTRKMHEKLKTHFLYNQNSSAADYKASAWDNAEVDMFGNAVPKTKPTFGKDSGKYLLYNSNGITELGEKLASDYNDPEWETVLDSIPLEQAKGVMNSGTFGSNPIDAVGLAKSNDRDGPAQVGSFNNGKNCGTGFPCATVLAQTFSTAITYNYGMAYGKEMRVKGIDGAYAFGCNLHRNPFGGRNYEYFSEDGMLTGILVAKLVRGLQNTGRYCFMKHLIVAETETGRENDYTWLSEQTLREIYLKPFQKFIEEPKCNAGVMTSYNRLGGIWSGGSEHLVTGVLRYEWNFKGAIDTDYADNQNYMHGGQSYRAGGNLGLHTNFRGTDADSNLKSPRLLHRMRQAVKEILFMHIYADYALKQYMANGDEIEKAESLTIEGFQGLDIESIQTKTLKSWVWWKPAYAAIEVVGFSGCALGLYFVFRPTPTKKLKKLINNPEDITGDSGLDKIEKQDNLDGIDINIENVDSKKTKARRIKK